MSFEKTKKWILLIFSFKIVRIYNKLVDIKILMYATIWFLILPLPGLVVESLKVVTRSKIIHRFNYG
jgi:hypothetical protein